MKRIEVLRAAAKLIEGGWTQFAWARDDWDVALDPDDSDARAFCARGAIAKAAGVPVNDALVKDLCGVLVDVGDLRKVRDEEFFDGVCYSVVGRWNDNMLTTQDEVLAVFLAAIKKETKK